MHANSRFVLTLMVATAVAVTSAGQSVPRRDASAAPAPQRSAPSTTNTRLTGRVVAADNGTTLHRALVTITVGGRVQGKAFSDDEGRFEIDGPNQPAYVITVAKAGFLTTTLPSPPARSGRATLDISLARSGVVAGRVVDPSGNPVVSIGVRLQRTDNATAFATGTTTDDLGAFRIAGLPPGRYSVETVGRPDYSSTYSVPPLAPAVPLVGGNLNAASSDTVTVDVQPGAVADATLAYREAAVILQYANVGGAITGQISDESGEAMPGLFVQAWRLEVDNGIVTATQYHASRVTDDRGQYRLFHLKAGRYVVIVTDGSSRTPNESSWLPVYYPGTPSPADAVVLTVGRSQELGGTDMVFTRTAGARISGVATNASGQPLKNVLSLSTSNRELPAPFTTRTMAVGVDGAFAFDRVPPGAYVLRASPSVPSGATIAVALREFVPSGALSEARDAEFAMQPISVTDADIGPIALRTAAPATLRGHIVFEGMNPIRTNFQIIAVTTDPRFNITGRASDGTVSWASIDPQTWTFEIPRLVGPIQFRLSAVPPTAWLKSAYVGATNAADSPIMFSTSKDSRDDVTLVIAGTAAVVSGRTTSATAQPVPGVQVLLFPTNRERWFIGSPYVHSIYSDESGRFTLTSVPPGEYWIVAIDSNENELQRRESERMELFDSLIAGAQRVTLGEGQTATVAPRTVTMNK